jgi:hypothetical protein
MSGLPWDASYRDGPAPWDIGVPQPAVARLASEGALAMARAKAADRGIAAHFAAVDAFELARLERMFHTVLDCGLFHTFDNKERARYVASVASVTEHGAGMYVLCFSDEGANTGPHPVGAPAWLFQNQPRLTIWRKADGQPAVSDDHDVR